MMRTPLLLLVTALVLVYHPPLLSRATPLRGPSLNSTSLSRKFETSDLHWLPLVRASDAFVTKACPASTIVHRAYALCGLQKNTYIIPHAAISQDGVQCGTGDPLEYMVLIPAEVLQTVELAVFHGIVPLYALLNRNVPALNAFKAIDPLDPIYVGFEYTASRVCGSVTQFAKGSVLFFINPTKGTNDINFNFAYLYIGEVGMITVDASDNLCMYKATRRLGPIQHKLLTPTPSPSQTNLAVSGEIFSTLKEAPGLKDCFPVAEFNVAVPSPTPTRSVTPTPGLSSSAMPSGGSVPSATASTTVSPGSVPSSSRSSQPSLAPGTSPSTSTSAQPQLSTAAVIDGSPTAAPTPTPAAASASPTASTSRVVRPTAAASPGGETEAVCFPGNAQVRLSNGQTIAMRDVRVGDEVQTGPQTFSAVLLTTHAAAGMWWRFVELEVATGARLTLSAGHYVPVGGRLVAAEAVRCGDALRLADGGWAAVMRARRVWRRGLHAPHTADGRIAVDGVVASTYTRAVRPATAVALLAPVKGLARLGLGARCVGARVSQMLTDGATGALQRWLPRGEAVC